MMATAGNATVVAVSQGEVLPSSVFTCCAVYTDRFTYILARPHSILTRPFRDELTSNRRHTNIGGLHSVRPGERVNPVPAWMAVGRAMDGSAHIGQMLTTTPGSKEVL